MNINTLLWWLLPPGTACSLSLSLGSVFSSNESAVWHGWLCVIPPAPSFPARHTPRPNSDEPLPFCALSCWTTKPFPHLLAQCIEMGIKPSRREISHGQRLPPQLMKTTRNVNAGSSLCAKKNAQRWNYAEFNGEWTSILFVTRMITNEDWLLCSLILLFKVIYDIHQMKVSLVSSYFNNQNLLQKSAFSSFTYWKA
jgi:hypothetical protein